LTEAQHGRAARVPGLRGAAAFHGHDQRGPRRTDQRRRRRRARVDSRRRLGPHLGPAHRTRGPGPQPRVDAVDVEDVAAVRQRAHLLAVRELRQAHRAVRRSRRRRRPVAIAAAAVRPADAVRGNRQRGERGRVEPVADAPPAEGAADAQGQAAPAARHELVQQQADEDEDDGEHGEDDDGREQDAAAEAVVRMLQLLLLLPLLPVHERARPAAVGHRWRRRARHGWTRTAARPKAN